MEQAGNFTRAERNPDATRQRILDSAFYQMYRKGYQGMRLDEVLAETELTKGALYHHFPNKLALGYAVVDEVILPIMDGIFLQPLKKTSEPLQALVEVIRSIPDAKPAEVIQYGCPLNNLAQEMSPLDEGFRQRIDYIFRIWHDAIAQTLERAQHQGALRTDIDCDATATFIMAALEGCFSIAKTAQSKERLATCNHGLIDYLLSLRA